MTSIVDSPTGVPFVDLGAQLAAIEDELAAAIARVLRRGAFILGPELEAFEAEMAAYCGARFAVGVDSGTSALELSLRVLGVGPGDEVVTAANSFVASAMAITHTGATPVFVDVDPATRNMNPAALEAAVTERTRALLPVHLYGHPADMEPIAEVADRHSLVVVEDACQAHGARYCGRRAGTLGAAAAFSFYPSKNLGGIGDGGIVVTSDEAMAARLRLLRNYGQASKNRSTEVGYNRRLDELQAAVLRIKLRRLDEWNAARAAAAARYLDALGGLDGVVLPAPAPWAEPVWHLFVVNVDDRARVQDVLARDGIETGVHYPIPIPQQPAYGASADGTFPVTEWNARTCLSLPMFPELGVDAVDRVVAALRRAVGRAG